MSRDVTKILMTMEISLEARKREETGRAVQALRGDGWIPAVLYGHGIENRNIALPELAFGRVLGKAGESTLVALSVDGDQPVNTLIVDTQSDPVSGKILHADLFQVRMDEEIEASVPLEFIGESAAVRGSGGILIKSLDEIEVRCLPARLPHAIEVDISVLATFDDRIRVADLVLPEGVEVVGETDTMIATVEPPRTEEELASLDEKVEVDVTKVEGVVKEAPASSEETKK